MRILLVDDDPEIRELVRIVLTSEGYDVVEAGEAAPAIAAAREHRPDLVLLDVMMPSVDGIGVLRALKASSLTSRIPVVMLTALDGPSDVAAATYAGAEGYITKPFEPDDLLTMVRRFSTSTTVH